MHSILTSSPQYYSQNTSQRPTLVDDNVAITFEQLIEKSDDGYLLLDHSGHIIRHNDKAKIMLGIEDYRGVSSRNSFINIAKQNFQLVRPSAWKNWPDLNGIPYLVKPQSENEKTQWIKVQTIPLKRDNASRRLLHLRDYSDLVFFHQKIHCFEHSLTHNISLPLKTMTDMLIILKQAATKTTLNDLNDVFDIALESGKYLSLMFMHLVDHFHQENPEETHSSYTLKKLIDDQKEWFENKTEYPQALSVDLAEKSENIRLGHKEKLFTIALIKLLTLIQQFHPTKKPRTQLSATTILDETFLMIVVTSDYCFGIKDTIFDLKQAEWDITKHLTDRPDNFKKGFRSIDFLVTSLGGFCSIKDDAELKELQITLAIPISNEVNNVSFG